MSQRGSNSSHEISEYYIINNLPFKPVLPWPYFFISPTNRKADQQASRDSFCASLFPNMKWMHLRSSNGISSTSTIFSLTKLKLWASRISLSVHSCFGMRAKDVCEKAEWNIYEKIYGTIWQNISGFVYAMQGRSNRHSVDPSLLAGGGVIPKEVLCNQVGMRRVPSGCTYLMLAQVPRQPWHGAGRRVWMENKLHHLLNTHLPMWPLKSHDSIIWLLQLLAAAVSQIVCFAGHGTDKMEGHGLKHMFSEHVLTSLDLFTPQPRRWLTWLNYSQTRDEYCNYNAKPSLIVEWHSGKMHLLVDNFAVGEEMRK